jgi:hypothetical protein
MHEGAFALIDCLGFKGIWKRTDQALLLEKLRSIMVKIHNTPGLFRGLPFHLLRRDFIITPSLLSDSVAISLRYEDDPSKDDDSKEEAKKIGERRERSYLVWLICASTIRVLDLYLKGEPGLVLRGCINYGEYEHNIIETGSFIVGPAVDDAAENMEVSQGAFVWLRPEAAALYRYALAIQRKTIRILYKRNDRLELLEGSKRSLREPIMVDPYDMPLKGGGHLRCPVLNPLAFHDSDEMRRAVFHAYEEAILGNNLDVVLKRQYTMEFLRKAEEARARHVAWYEGFIDSLENNQSWSRGTSI